MIRIWRRRDKLKNGKVKHRIFACVQNESLSPLSVLAGSIPDPKKGATRTIQKVRVNRGGNWAVWSCVDSK